METLNIIIPAYNEKNTIGKLITELKQILQKNKIPYNIIVVNDGSTDNTKESIIESSVTVIQHPIRKGYGASIKDGLNVTDSNPICIIDADGTYSPYDIPFLLSNMDNYDMIVGSRTKSSSLIYPTIYKLSNFFICSILNLIFGQKILDINSGLRIIKKNILMKYKNILPDGFSLTATITFAMILDNYKIKYVPIDYHKRIGKSKVKPLSYSFNFIESYFRILLYKFKTL